MIDFIEPINPNTLQLYELYRSIPLSSPGNLTRIYPKYVKITGRSFSPPAPHEYLTFTDFIVKLEEDEEFIDIILNKHNKYGNK